MTLEPTSRVLLAVNVIRYGLGERALDELPKGKPGTVGDCVLARALGVMFEHSDRHGERGSGYLKVIVNQDGTRVEPVTLMMGGTFYDASPPYGLVSADTAFAKWMRAFDAGELPELIEAGS